MAGVGGSNDSEGFIDEYFRRSLHHDLIHGRREPTPRIAKFEKCAGRFQVPHDPFHRVFVNRTSGGILGLFDEHPILLQPKQKKKRGKRKIKQEDIQLGKRGKKKSSSLLENSAGPSSSLIYIKKKEPPSPRLAKNAMIQTDPRPINPNENLVIHNANPTNSSDGFTNFIINRDQSKVQEVQIVHENKVRETTHVLTGPWTTGTTTIKRDVDYFSKNNIWHAVYNLHTTESQTCNTDLNTTRMTSCQQQSTSDHLADL